MSSQYTPTITAQDSDIPLRGLRHRVHIWGHPSSPPVFLLHGWVDTGTSFQFLADHLAEKWQVIAPDWRGFGDSAWDANGYWFPDYLADLDALLEHFTPNAPARVVGHSMGGNAAGLYAGIRPERVSHLAVLDVAGLQDTHPDEAPDRYARWLSQLQNPARFAPLRDHDAALALVRKLAPTLAAGKAAFIADQWARPAPDGTLHLPHDPRHKHVNPVLYRRSEARACWKRISAHTLLVLAKQGQVYPQWDAELRADVTNCIPHLRIAEVDCGHMLHLEKPEELAQLLNTFLTAT